MISTLARYTTINLALIAAFGILKGWYDQGESYIDFSAIGLVKLTAIFFAMLLIVLVLWISRNLELPRDQGGFGR